MNKRHYDDGFKAEAVKLAREIGVTRAAGELQIPYHTLSNWMRKARKGSIDLGQGTLEPSEALSIVAELQMLKKQVRDLQRENKRIKEENEILADAAAFFAASRQKSGKPNG